MLLMQSCDGSGLSETDAQTLQVAVGAARTDHQFVVATDDAHGVGCGIPRLETLTGQADDGLAGLAWFQADTRIASE